jgi:hypothetical protein
MAREKKMEAPVTLFAAIETTQHDALRSIAFEQHRSVADIVREAIGEYIARRPGKKASRRLAAGRR